MLTSSLVLNLIFSLFYIHKSVLNMYIRATSFLVSNRDLHMSIGTDTKLPPLYAQEMEKKI